MKLKTHLQTLTAEDREALARLCRTTLGHLRNVMYGYRPCSAELAADIERATGGTVTRKDMRPDDWQRIWPELAEAISDGEASQVHMVGAAAAGQQGVAHG